MSGSAREGFDARAAVTRSMLGWGVVAGPFYLLVAVVHAALKEGFDFSRHALSLLMLSDTGWIQRVNLILVGLMVIVAAIGFARSAEGPGRARWLGALLGVYGATLIGSGIFAPDPMGGFPPGAEETASIGGVLHLAFGALGFLALGIAALVAAGWLAARYGRGAGALSAVAGVVVIAGFAAGAALATSTAGIVALWAAVVVGFAWLLVASIGAYRTVPHPDLDRR